MAYLPSDLTVRYSRSVEYGLSTISFEIWSRSEGKLLDRGRNFLAGPKSVYGDNAKEAVEIAKRRLCGEVGRAA